jgi:hypothetical protein
VWLHVRQEQLAQRGELRLETAPAAAWRAGRSHQGNNWQLLLLMQMLLQLNTAQHSICI